MSKIIFPKFKDFNGELWSIVRMEFAVEKGEEIVDIYVEREIVHDKHDVAYMADVFRVYPFTPDKSEIPHNFVLDFIMQLYEESVPLNKEVERPRVRIGTKDTRED